MTPNNNPQQVPPWKAPIPSTPEVAEVAAGARERASLAESDERGFAAEAREWANWRTGGRVGQSGVDLGRGSGGVGLLVMDLLERVERVERKTYRDADRQTL